MYRLLYGFMPWWGFAFLAISFGLGTIPSVAEYRAAQSDASFAINEGPPAVVDITNFNPNRDIGYFDEVHINGQILANWNILRFGGEGTDYDGIVLGNGDTGVPMAVLMFESASSGQPINQLISGATIENRVSVQGFLTNVRRSEVERQLTRQGYSGQNVLVIEPFFETRSGIIADKVGTVRFALLFSAGATLLFTLLAVWRFRSWRKRRAAKKSRNAAKRATAQPAIPMSTPAPAGKPQPSAKTTNPWGGKQKPKPQSQTPVAQPAPRPKPVAEPEPELTVATSEFQSVFPGGGSGFRFKTTDEIVREYFGTLTRISQSNPDH